jgi:hypothetical protein
MMDIYYNSRKSADSSTRSHQRIDALERGLHRLEIIVAKIPRNKDESSDD